LQQKIFIEHKKRLNVKFSFQPAHYRKKLVAGFIEIDKLTFPAKQGRRGAKVTSYRTPCRGD